LIINILFSVLDIFSLVLGLLITSSEKFTSFAYEKFIWTISLRERIKMLQKIAVL